MPGHVDFSADLILICNSLDAGGIERVVSTLANEWTRRGPKVCVVTMHDRRQFFKLDPTIHHVVIDKAGVTWLAECLKKLKMRFESVRLPKSLLIAIFGEAFINLCADKLFRVNFRLCPGYKAWALRRALEHVDSPVVVARQSTSSP
jgi:hypothetical protein